jgi:hypothetical protein
LTNGNDVRQFFGFPIFVGGKIQRHFLISELFFCVCIQERFKMMMMEYPFRYIARRITPHLLTQKKMRKKNTFER